MFEITPTGMLVMDAIDEFYKIMQEKGVRDPFKIEQSIFQSYTKENADGSIQMDLDAYRNAQKPSREEKNAWIIAEDEYIAEKLFNEAGYEEFEYRTRPKIDYDISYLRDLDKFVPCRAKDGQCMLTCKNFGKDCSVLANAMGD